MKIVYVSGVKFGYDLLDHILKNNYKIDAVFSYQDSKKKLFTDYVSFDHITDKYKIKHIKVNNINDKENILILQNIQPDIILVMGWSQLIKDELLKIPQIGVLGSHPTELPKYRGRAPIPWTIIKELKESALTFFFMDSGVDSGDISNQHKFEISNDDDATTLYHKITSLGKKMIIETLSDLKKGKITRNKQDQSQFIEYWEKRTPLDGKIEWSNTGKEIQKLIRASTFPYPGAFTFLNDKKIIIWKSKYLKEKSGGVGKILEINDDGVKIGTGEGNILIQKFNQDLISDNFEQNVFSKQDLGKILT